MFSYSNNIIAAAEAGDIDGVLEKLRQLTTLPNCCLSFPFRLPRNRKFIPFIPANPTD